ncbi:unnamed protein product [Arctogadus glacialis]
MPGLRGGKSDHVIRPPREEAPAGTDRVLDNPALYYSAVKKDKQNLRKKVGEEGSYAPMGSMANLERQELNYAALEFGGARSREGGARRAGDDGSDYSEIKAK